MTLYGSITNDSGLTASIRAMHLEVSMFGVNNDNILGFDKVGYQRKEPVVSSFAQYLGANALSTTVDDTIGRLVATQQPLDLALAEKGYFQIKSSEGVKLTRDGRFKIDKDGYLLSQLNENVLSNNGMPIKLPVVPQNLSDIKIDQTGAIYIYNPQKMTQEYVTSLGIVTDDKSLVTNPGVQQGYNEYSNVQLGSEFMRMVPVKRNFEANRRMFIIQSTVLTNMISKLSSAN